MSKKKAVVNELLQHVLAEAISQNVEFPDGLITVVYVECSPDYHYADIGLSILPDHLAGTALKRLRAKTSLIAKIIKTKTRIRAVPRLRWLIDSTEKEAAKLEEIFQLIEQEG